jgi:DNA processing protein
MLTSKAIQRSAQKDITWKQLLLLNEELDQTTPRGEQVKDRCAAYGIGGEEKGAERYHYKFARLSAPPVVMYWLWDKSLLDKPLLAIVWPRTPSSFLQTVTKDLCSRLSSFQLCTISGGAEGIDLLAHQCSLAWAVPTIVVLGAWFRRYKNRPEWNFFQEIVWAWWLILSERKIDQSPAPYTFPQRNRIIAGCADAVFVPGASVGSWSLITVDFALQFGIPVVTVPGSFYEPTCAGTNAYLCQRKITGSTDLDAFLQKHFLRKKALGDFIPSPQDGLTDQEQGLLLLLQQESVTTNALAHTYDWNISQVLELLLSLEMKQLIYSPEPWCRKSR